MQLHKSLSCEILPDETVRYCLGALKTIKCSLELEQSSPAAADPQSPVRSSVVQNGQMEAMQDTEHMSPKQMQEAMDQQTEENKQYQRQHLFCGAASVKVHRPDCTHGRAF